MKRLLFCMGCLCMITGAVKAQMPVNPGFETGSLPPWTIWQPTGGGTPQVVPNNAKEGSYAVMLSGGRGSIEQIVTGLKPWRKYTLTAWVKVASSGDSATLGAKLYKGSETVTARIKSTAYTQYSLTFATGGNNTKVTIYLQVHDSTSVIYGDAFSIVEVTPVQSHAYYIDNMGGNDANNGLSPATAWKTITKVSATTFYPGDSVLFKSDGQWSGTLRPQGEGAPGRPILVSSYGSTATKPIFNGNGALRTIYLSNQQYFDITNLEITNSASPGSKKRGIEVENVDRGKLTHIRIYQNNVHDVLGDNVKGQDGSMGIMAVVRKGNSANVPSWFDSLVIENNIVKKVNRSGIGTSSDWRCVAEWGCTSGTGYYPSTNMFIRNNYVENAGGDGIIPIACDGALVEHNIVNGANVSSGNTANVAIWCFTGRKNVFQFNEAYNVKSAIDGEGYDVDYNQDSTLFQYNYSHDNEGGFMLLCTNVRGANTNPIVRYNVSQNDKYRIIMLNGNVQNAQIYNNTLYLPAGSTTKPIVVDNWGGYFPENIYVRNNIFYLTAAGPWTDWDSIGGSRVFDHNIIYGVHTAGEPAGTNTITSDPLLVAPGTGTTGGMVGGILTFGNVDGYKLQSGSPAIAAGAVIAGNGGRDYWGNTVPASGAPDIGAYNSGGAGARKAVAQLECFPNPVNRGSVVTAWVTAPVARKGWVTIADNMGHIIQTQSVALVAGKNKIIQRLPNVSAGLYTMTVTQGSKGLSGRLLIQ